MEVTTVLIIVFITFAIIIALAILVRQAARGLNKSQQNFIKKQWRILMGESTKNIHAAILDADKLLGHVMQIKGYAGSVGEQLKKAGPVFHNVDNVWYAHKIRNRIAHEMNIQIPKKEGEKVLSSFKQGLQDLGAKI
jgi:hypothetical protein